MRDPRTLIAVLALCLMLALAGCGGGADEDAQSPQGETTAPAQADPLTPADKAQDAADDANAVIQEQSTEIDELTDSE